MKIGLRSHDGSEERLRFAQQIGADGASIWGWALPGYQEQGYPTLEGLLDIRERFAQHDLALTGIGLGAEVIKNQLLDRPGREEDVAKVAQTIRTMGQAYEDAEPTQSPVLIIDQRLTYWEREGYTGGSREPIGRGGARLYRFDATVHPERFDAPAGEVSRDQVWERMTYLYERIVPVAEEAGIHLATHPDDPPMDTYRGVEQVLTGLDGFREFTERFPSPNNGLLLCLGCMQERGEDINQVIRYFGQRDLIFYVHLRNVLGQVPRYQEVFLNQGDMDVVAALRALKAVGYDRYLVPDHHVALDGDGSWQQGSRAWAVGYLQGLMQALDL
jgi:mannonate dehydratase